MAWDREISHGRDITWTLRAKQAPDHIREAWLCTSWIAELQAIGTHDGKPFQAVPIQPANHARSMAATGARPLEPGELALDPRHPAA